ncbi:hypothetical protein [Hyella patelloides]|nr:hypothetical protein [Hyella patelloides]
MGQSSSNDLVLSEAVGDLQKLTGKIKGFFAVLKFGKFRKINNKKKEETIKDSSINNALYSNLSNDIVINSSGQVKINNLDSCLDLVSSDFIVF